MSRDSAPTELLCLDSYTGCEQWLLRNPHDHSQWILFTLTGTVRIEATDGDIAFSVGTLEWLANRARIIWEEGEGNKHDHREDHSAGDR